MLERLPRHALSLDPLIAEAKRRARQRRVVIVLLALALAGGGTGLVFGGLAAYRAVSATRVSYERTSLVVAASSPVTLVTKASLAEVATASSGAAWIVGSVAWHWDGKAWRSVPLPKTEGALQSVATVSARDAWAVGSAGLEHWNGVRWSVVRPLTSRWPVQSTISAAAADDVWAAGTTDVGPAHARPVLLHWNGASWRTQALPWSRTGAEIEKVVAIGGGRLWALVRQYHSDAIRATFWNGERWRFVPAPFGSRDPLFGFAATAWNDAWAVGSYRDGLSRSIAAHWDGRAWRVVSVPQAPGYNDSELDGVADVGPGDAWAVGRSNVYKDNSVTAPVPVFFHWDGASWHLISGAAPSLSFSGGLSIAAGRDGSAWAIGSGLAENVVFRLGDGRWSVAPHPHDTCLRPGVPASMGGHAKLPTCTPSG